MKRFNLFVFFLILMRFTTHAQESTDQFKDRFYAKVGGGYGIGLCYYDPCDDYDEDYYPTYDNLNLSICTRQRI